jgi:hypothetical protein
VSDEAPAGLRSGHPISGITGSVRAGDLLASALAALGALADLGETVEDEWTYVTKLAEMGRARIRTAVPDGDALVPAATAAAIDALAAEAGRITDPHRAIDWLSTLPAVAELALGTGAGAVPVPGTSVGGTPAPGAGGA